MTRSSLGVLAAKFAGLSGAGWLLDFCLLLVLVRYGGMPVFGANLVSACTAAVTVFLLSRRKVFRVSHGSAAGRAGIYFVYTVGVILVASAAMRGLVGVFSRSGVGWLRTPASAAGLAKVVVTPVNLLLNFWMAKRVSEFGREEAAE